MTGPDVVRDATPEEVAASIVPVALRQGTYDSEETAIGWNMGFDSAVSQQLQDDPALFAVALRAAADRLAPNPDQEMIDRLHAAIENAPHDPVCEQWDLQTQTGRPLTDVCTCWKADVL